jgi:hypothetical protein
MGTLKWHSIRTKLNRCKLAFMRDGGGLYLVVRESGDRVWAFRFTDLDGKRAQMEFARIGDRDSVAGDVLTLSSAGNKAREYKVALKRDGVDPRVKKRAAAQRGKTFKEFAEEQYPGWCKGLSEEEEKQWARSIRDAPSLHDLKVHEITTEQVLEALKPIWSVKPVTASRTRHQAIEIIRSMPRTGKYVFPSDHAETHQPFRANALVGSIERTGIKSTMHGCRTSFRNWGADNKNHNFRREVLEFCLSHRIGDEAELSYWDSEMIARRREALQAWADFIKPRKNTSGEQPPERKRPKLKLIA